VTHPKKGGTLDPQASLRRGGGEARRGSARAARTPALRSPSACAGTCARLGLAKVQAWGKRKAVQPGVTGASEVDFECAHARSRAVKKKARW
jgi:hypothetical protein